MKRIIFSILILFFAAGCTFNIYPKVEKFEPGEGGAEDGLPPVEEVLKEDPKKEIPADVPQEYSKTIGGIPRLTTLADTIDLLTIHGVTGSAVWKKFYISALEDHMNVLDSTAIVDSLAQHRTEIDALTASSVSDGDKGDVTVSGSGTTWSIDAGAVGPDEIASTAVTPGSYTNTDITVDADGRITAASSGSGGSGHVIADEGTGLTARDTLDFVGAGVTVTDGGTKTTVTIAGGGGVSGSGTTNKLAKWSSSSALTDALITDDGTNLTLSGGLIPKSWTTAGRPVGITGLTGYNSDLTSLETYLGADWYRLPKAQSANFNANHVIYTDANGVLKQNYNKLRYDDVNKWFRIDDGSLIVYSTSNGGASASFTNSPTTITGLNYLYGVNNTVTVTNTASGVSGAVYGQSNGINLNGTANFSGTLIGGMFTAASNLDGGTVDLIQGIVTRPGSTASVNSTMITVQGLAAGANLYASSAATHKYITNMYDAVVGITGHFREATITNRYGFYASDYTATGPNGNLTNQYGLYLANMTSGSSLNYAIYSLGGQSYHAGNFGLNDSTPDALLDVAGDAIVTGVIYLNDAKTVGIFHGTGTPEGVVSASVGSTFHRTDGGASTTYYVKESGTGNTGWIAK